MKRFRNIIVISMFVALLIITQTGCGSEIKTVSKDNYFLDTTCNITVFATGEDGSLDEAVANEAIDQAYELCALLDKTISKTVEVSDIAKLNAAGGEWTEVSDYTAELLRNGLEYSENSGGVFDITIGRLTDLWDFHAENPVLPDDKDLADAAQHVDYNCVQIDGNRVRMTDSAAKIDLGGIAKGYIGDKMVELLEENGVTSGIVNLGGNIICIGGKPGSGTFNIGVEAPFSDRTEIVGSIEVADKTLVTSGVYERMFEINGKIYHHILDINSGYPVTTDLDSVTIVADKGHSMNCDAMSTICLIKGYEGARKYIDSVDGVSAVFVLSDGTVKTTDGLELHQ